MTLPEQWLRAHSDQGHCLYLMLDCDGQLDARDALLKGLTADQYRSVYIGTAASSQAADGPYIFRLDRADHPILKTLLETPDLHWGWLAASTDDDIAAISSHWSARLISGERPNQALYRFHDNRVLGRALAHLQPEQYPTYLGPLDSVCYWHDDQWMITNNPDPGAQPLPAEPPWLAIPTPAATYASVQFDNVHRYLMAEHTDAFARLAQYQDVNAWLRNLLDLAHAWGWREPEHLHFLLMQTLQSPDFSVPTSWSPQPEETPTTHFERLYQEARYWQGDAAS